MCNGTTETSNTSIDSGAINFSRDLQLMAFNLLTVGPEYVRFFTFLSAHYMAAFKHAKDET